MVMGRKKSCHVHSAPSDDETMFSHDHKPKRIYQLWPGNNVSLFFLANETFFFLFFNLTNKQKKFCDVLTQDLSCSEWDLRN